MSETVASDAAATAARTVAEVSSPAAAGDGKPKRASVRQVFAEMPWVVRLSSIWLIFIFGGAIYAKVDTVIFDGALPLQDPNFQTNNFDASTGTFGDGEPIAPPSAQHWLGTDAIARDTFARIMHGGWVSLIVALVAAGFGVIVGGFLGSLVGFVRGKTEVVIMSVIDVILLEAGPTIAQAGYSIAELIGSFDKHPVIALTTKEREHRGIAAVAAGAQAYICIDDITVDGQDEVFRHAIDRHKLQQRLSETDVTVLSILRNINDGVIVVEPAEQPAPAEPARQPEKAPAPPKKQPAKP